jgi:NAD(P)-dependent dehydrogenase (short-subunit alcohol dehydrogenase family)
MKPQLYAIIAGVGPGSGAAIARRFSKAYTVVLLARNPGSFSALKDEINESGGRAVGIATDVASADSVKAAFRKIDEEFGQDSLCAVGVHLYFVYAISATCINPSHFASDLLG